MDESPFLLVGIDASTENIYRMLLTKESIDVEAVTSTFGLDQDEAAGSLERLRELGLVIRAANGTEYFAVDPRHSLRVVVDRQISELDRVRDALGPLGNMFDDARRGDRALTKSQLVSSTEALGDLYYRMKHQAVKEFLAFDRPPQVLATNTSLNGSLLRRGVETRAIYAAERFGSAGSWDSIRELVSYGEEARVIADLPVKLAIADRSVGLISLNLSQENPEFLVTEDGPMLEALVALFESYWVKAVPMDFGGATAAGNSVSWDEVALRLASEDKEIPVSAPRKASGEEHDLLTMFAGGLKDEAIAQQLGISTRTLRRRILVMFGELGASNRFAAGVAAAKRGWI